MYYSKVAIIARKAKIAKQPKQPKQPKFSFGCFSYFSYFGCFQAILVIFSMWLFGCFWLFWLWRDKKKESVLKGNVPLQNTYCSSSFLSFQITGDRRSRAGNTTETTLQQFCRPCSGAYYELWKLLLVLRLLLEAIVVVQQLPTTRKGRPLSLLLTKFLYSHWMYLRLQTKVTHDDKSNFLKNFQQLLDNFSW